MRVSVSWVTQQGGRIVAPQVSISQLKNKIKVQTWLMLSSRMKECLMIILAMPMTTTDKQSRAYVEGHKMNYETTSET